MIFETSAICEYIEDTAPEHPLWPSTPLERSRHRGWAEFASAVIADVFRFYTAPGPEAFERKCVDLAAKSRRLEGQLGTGPYFHGRDFGLVDAAFAPVFRLFDTFDAIGDFGIFAGLVAVPAYRRALADRPSVSGAVVRNYDEDFRCYLRQRASHLSWLLGEAGAGPLVLASEQQGRGLADR